jgi:multidrug resistance efflux pump
MRNDLVLDLADCTEFRQALQARPPGIVHGTLVLILALLGTALGWSAATRATLVVQGSGRIRPVTAPKRVFNTVRGEVLSASVGGRVVEVNFREGDRIREGDVLIRLDTGRIDNEIVKQGRTIRAREEDLAKIDHLKELLSRQYEATRSRAVAELAQVRGEIRRAKEKQKSEVRLVELALESAVKEEAPLERQLKKGYIAPIVLTRAKERINEAQEKLAVARIPVDEGRVDVALREVELVERDFALKREELEQKQVIRRAEVEAARTEMANLELEREQAVIRAPLSGIVTAGDVKAGDILESGKAIAEIAPQLGYRFEAAVPSEEVGRLRVGMPARIKLDAYDSQRYGTLDGTVCFVSPDSGLEKERKAAFYTVRIAVQRDELGRGAYRGRVKLGMTGRVEIVTGSDRLLTLLVRTIHQTISLN